MPLEFVEAGSQNRSGPPASAPVTINSYSTQSPALDGQRLTRRVQSTSAPVALIQVKDSGATLDQPQAREPAQVGSTEGSSSQLTESNRNMSISPSLMLWLQSTSRVPPAGTVRL